LRFDTGPIYWEGRTLHKPRRSGIERRLPARLEILAKNWEEISIMIEDLPPHITPTAAVSGRQGRVIS